MITLYSEEIISHFCLKIIKFINTNFKQKKYKCGSWNYIKSNWLSVVITTVFTTICTVKYVIFKKILDVHSFEVYI